MKKLTQLILAAMLIACGFAQSASAQVDLTFSINMSLQIAKGAFNPTTDFVDVVGFDNTWDERKVKATNPNVMTDADNDGIYTITKTGVATPMNDTVKYKYRINGSWANSDQSPAYGDKDGNRILETVGDGAYSTPVEFYLDEEGTIVKVDITFKCDMSYQKLKGNFVDTSFVDVTGYNGVWDEGTNKATNTNVLTDPDNDSIYTLTVTNVGVIIPKGSTEYKIKYKYRINGSWATSDESTLFGDKDKNRIVTVTASVTTYTTNDIYKDETTTGINNFSAINTSINLSQNPVADQLLVLNQNTFNYSIYGAIGQVVSTGNTNDGSLNVSDLASGIYYLRVVTDKNKVGTTRFVKQ